MNKFKKRLREWKPIHLCWLFEKLGLPIPLYFIGGGDAAPQYEGSRISNATRTWQADEDASVIGWNVGDDFCVSVAWGAVTGKKSSSRELRLRWRNVTDEGTFVDLGSSGELTYNADTDLVNDDALNEAETGLSASQTYYVYGKEREGANAFTYTELSEDRWTACMWAVNCDNAHPEDQYEFELYNQTDGAQIAVCLAKITMATGGYTLVCDGGSYSHIGSTINGLKSSLLNLGSDSYAISGQPVGVYYNRRVSADGGSYNLTGQDLNFLRNYRLLVEGDSYAISGQEMFPKYSRIFSMEAGNYGITGSDVDLIYTVGYLLQCEGGSYALTGQILDLFKSSKIDIGSGSYLKTGQDLGLLKSNKIDIGEGSYLTTGQIINLFYNRLISIDSETYALTGSDVDLIYTGGGYVLVCEGGVYALSGQDLSLFKNSLLQLSSGNYAITGQVAELLKLFELTLASGNYTIDGKIADLFRSLKLQLESGNYQLSGKDIDLILQSVIPTSIHIFNAQKRKHIFRNQDES